MITFIKERFSGEKAALFGFINQGVNALLGPAAALSVVQCLLPVEQGYYYTFYSLIGLQVFLEMGISYCVIQFVCHEAASLSFSPNGSIAGGDEAQSRLRSIARFGVTWFSIAAAILFFGLSLGGLFFFKSSAHNIGVNWESPWLTLCALTSLSMLLTPFSALLEGCNDLVFILKTRAVGNILRLGALLGGLWFGLGLWAVPAASAMFTGTHLVAFYCYRKNLLSNLVKPPNRWLVSWRNEIWPFQWRISLSWMSGYFIFTLYNPMVFKMLGPVEAGQYGVSYSLASGIFSLAAIWLNIKVPAFGGLVSRKSWSELRRVWLRSLRMSLVTQVLGFFALFSLVYVFRDRAEIHNRLLGFAGLFALCLAGFGQTIVSAQAAYVRAFKQEPFLCLSIGSAFITIFGSYLGAKFFGVTGVACSFALVTWLGLLASTFIKRSFLRVNIT